VKNENVEEEVVKENAGMWVLWGEVWKEDGVWLGERRGREEEQR
jgi:hypothetical protein